MAQVSLNLNKDNTLTVRVGDSVEHISLQDKSKGEIYDQVKYALITYQVYLDQVSLTELIYDAMRPSVRLVEVPTNGRQEVEHNTVTFTECMVEGCTNPARHPLVKRGPYMLKCEEHYQAMRKSLVGSQQKAWQTRRKKAAMPTEPAINDTPVKIGAYEAHAQKIREAARRVDIAIEAVDSAVAEYKKILENGMPSEH